MITQERLKELLHYDADTGVFTWLVSTAPRVKVGDIAGSKNVLGYFVIKIDYNPYKTHRLAWLYVYGRFPEVTDHINGIRDDNRISNLREVTQRENLQNMKKYTRQDPSLPTGVLAAKYKDIQYAYSAHWHDLSGKLQRSPNFNFTKLGGQDIALQQALSYREARMSELISQGASYTDRHGQ